MNITDMLSSPAGTANTSSTAAQENTDPADNATPENISTGEDFATFLTLLTAQIKNQDPLAPLDSTQFVEQLATFSGLELQATANNHLENIAAMLGRQTYSTPPADTAATTKTQSKIL